MKEQRLALAEKAAHLAPYQEHAERTAADVKLKREQFATRQAELETTERDFKLVVERFAVEEQRGEERREAERELSKLLEMAPIVRTLASQQQAIDKLVLAEKGCTIKLEALDAELIKLREAKLAANAQVKETELETAELTDKLDQLRLIEQQGKQLKRVVDVEKEMTRIALLEKEFAQTLSKTKDNHDQLEAAWLEGQASLLAAHLHEGMPCPVCGSEEHPAKSVIHSEIPSRERLQEAKLQLAAVEREWLEARAQAAAAQATREDGAKELAEFGLKAVMLEEQRTQLLQLWRGLKEDTDKLLLKVKQLPELKQLIERQEQQLEKQQLSKEQLQQEQQRLIVLRTSQQSALQQELGRIPETLRTPEKLTEKLNEQQVVYDRMSAAWKSVQEQQQK